MFVTYVCLGEGKLGISPEILEIHPDRYEL